ncbi:protein FAR-RED IMPAIRED RESPONSE 1-like [Tasmannia lanceolata]|uniref:protein FAR-RED IMPAIRED RESPONSE 1-like n=1 Tax=Tasmannia lanceolata TaxID=3420 RepID=UPI004064C2C6
MEPTFFYAMQVDEENRLKSVIWVDAKSRVDYAHFGDVVTFDTTYLTNTYSTPFAPFVGVNHHGQSVLFGCALIADETIPSFIWVLETWVFAMFNHHPKAIITDQDRAMKAAIALVFSKTRHRFCLWHIAQKIPIKVGHLCRDGGSFITRWNDCIYSCMTVAEFEEKWEAMVRDYNLGDNDWVKLLFEGRQHWVPMYLKDTFFAGMSTSQRSESINTFFYGYFNKKTTLQEFIQKYQLALQSRYEKEAEEDFMSFNKEPILKTTNPFEKQLSIVYTRGIFKIFQVEVIGLASCVINNIQHYGKIVIYSVKDLGEKDEYKVIWNKK